MEGFWSLPSPSAFVDALLYDMAGGMSVVLRCPRRMPVGLCRTLLGRIRDRDEWLTSVVDVEEAQARIQPAELLYGRFGAVDIAGNVDERSLAESECFRRRAVMVRVQTPAAHEAWFRFINRYTEIIKDRTLHDRSVLCIELTNTSPDHLFRENPALSLRSWSGWVGRLDMGLLSASLVEGRNLSPLQTRVAVATIAELAGYDGQLAQRLAEVPLEILMNPKELLRAYGVERGWHNIRQREITWEDGGVDEVDGERFVHSAWLTLQGLDKQVQRRVWRGQLQVLLPYVEEQRLDVVEQTRRFIRVPLVTEYGTYTEAEDIEIGALKWCLAREPISRGVRDRLTALAWLRNELAHLRPIPGHRLPRS